MLRQWPSRLHGARAELRRGFAPAPNGSRPAADVGTVGRGGNFFGMLHAKIAFAAGVMAAALLGGIALGGYTAGGFKEREQTDIIAQAASRVRSGGFRAEAAEPQAPMYHVCKGCDAKLYREDDWYGSEAVYDTDEEWAREEQESRDVIRAALADGSHNHEDREPAPLADDFHLDQDVAGQSEIAMARLDD
ncbi:MAG: hypothetical protein J7485_03310 [Sphingobium sp.]|nr:hypothetical protein [Sphingobium sp.]